MSKNPKDSASRPKNKKDASDKRSMSEVSEQSASPGRRPRASVVNGIGPSLDTGGGVDPGDGRVHGSGFTGDNGKYQQQSGSGRPVSQQSGHNGDLGAEGDEIDRGVHEDREERALDRPRSR